LVFSPCHPPLLTGSSLVQLELQKIIDNQARELALISSAWYDLHSRLQSNNITVSRFRNGANMSELQKGWLGKQRSLLAGR
jgi:protein HOOK3